MAALLCAGLVSMSGKHVGTNNPLSQVGLSGRMTPVPLHHTAGRTLKAMMNPRLDDTARDKSLNDRVPPTSLSLSTDVQQQQPHHHQEKKNSKSNSGGDGTNRWLLEHSRRLARFNESAALLERKQSPSTDLALGHTAEDKRIDGRHSEKQNMRLVQDYTSLFEAIPRRDDTSYVYCIEAQMVGAQRLGDDGIPRMSLIIPTVEDSTTSATNTGGANRNLSSTDVLHIDCNVVSSKVVTISGNGSAPVSQP